MERKKEIENTIKIPRYRYQEIRETGTCGVQLQRKKKPYPFIKKEDLHRLRLLLGCGFLGLLLKSQFFVCVYIFRERKKLWVFFRIWGERLERLGRGGVFFGVCGEEARFYRCFRNARLIFLRFALPSFSTEPKQIEFLPFYFYFLGFWSHCSARVIAMNLIWIRNFADFFSISLTFSILVFTFFSLYSVLVKG